MRLSSELGTWQYGRGSDGGGFDQNIGVAGVVYILSNDGLKEGYYKIGCSRRSGYARAFDLNVDANTGTPGSFKCVFEQRTLDCGRAERLVFERLRKHRRGKFGQEFFEIELDLARQTISSVCADVDSTYVAPSQPAPRLTPPSAATSTTVGPPREEVREAPAPGSLDCSSLFCSFCGCGNRNPSRHQ